MTNNEKSMKKVNIQDVASANMVQQNMQQIKTLFPEAVTEDGVNFDTLRQLLGDLTVLDEGEEKYGLNWHGKKRARHMALTPSLGTLLPCPEESVDWDTTQNLFIEGDNLEVLKCLQKSYANKVKMIYIDPPYNTGKEFIYPDKFQDNLDTYLKYTGQVDDDGMKFTSNTETSGRKHTNWLNMMYPRLKLARHLLKDDGVIFISIDDNEQANLKEICDEIFGEENFIAELIWKRRASSALAHNNVSADHEYVLCYQKGMIKEFLGVEKDFKKYSNPDNDPRGPWISDNLTVGMNASVRPNQAYNLKDPETGTEYPFNPNRVWAYIPETMHKMINERRILFPRDSSKRPMLKRFQNELKSNKNPFSTLLMDKVGLNTEATKSIQEIMGGSIFEYSKPLSLIKTLLKQVTQNNDLVIDFFAGSGTTAQAVMEQNLEDQFNRKFIMIQLPENCDKKLAAYRAGFKAISDIGKERIRRAAKKIKEEHPDYTGDLGFKVFKLDRSNMNAWDLDPNNLSESLYNHTVHLVEGRSEQDILYELLLKRGVDLATPIETKQIASKNVYSIGYGKIITCLDDSITRDDVEPLATGIVEWQNELKTMLDVTALDTHVFFKDCAFNGNDVAKANMVAILDQHGIPHVQSL